MEIDIDYPDRDAERQMLIATTGLLDPVARPVLSREELQAAQRLVRRLPVGESVVEAILDLVRAARPGEGDPAVTEHLAWGPGPRASQALMLTVRARALLQGRLAPSVEDVAALALPILKHRMALSYAARAEGMTIGELVERLTRRLG